MAQELEYLIIPSSYVDTIQEIDSVDISSENLTIVDLPGYDGNFEVIPVAGSFVVLYRGETAPPIIIAKDTNEIDYFVGGRPIRKPRPVCPYEVPTPVI